MFNSINLKKITTAGFLAILMAGTLIPQPAISGSTKNNGHGNNCDGIDSSNPGNGSPDGKNRNHNETDPNFDDEGRGNCSTDTQRSNRGNRRQKDIRGQQQNNALLPTETFQGQVNYVVTGGTLRKKSNKVNASSLKSTSSGLLSDIPSNATIQKAYLYWAGSGSTVDNQVTFNGSSVTADRTYTENIGVGGMSLNFFQGVKDVTNIVRSKGNGDYTFSGLTVDKDQNYSYTQTVLSGWSLIVIFEDPSITKLNTIELYEGFEGSVGTTKNYTLDGIVVSKSPQAQFSMLLWEGDKTLGGNNESFKFNNHVLKDSYNPKNNQFNSSINTLGSTKIYGVDFDTFNVSNYVQEGQTSITGSITTDMDLVIQGSAVVMVTDDLAVIGGGSGSGSGSNSNQLSNIPDITVEIPYTNTNDINIYLPDDISTEGIFFDDLSRPNVGTAKIQDNTIVYTPPSNPGAYPSFGTVYFEYTLKDSMGNTSAPAKIELTINQPPQAQNNASISFTTPYNTIKTINGSTEVLNHYSDLEGDTLTIKDEYITTEYSGTVEIVNGNIQYTPNANFNGKDSFKFTVVDSAGNEIPGKEITVTVQPKPTPINLPNYTIGTAYNTPITINVLDDIPTNDRQGKLIIQVETNPSNGSATIDDNGNLVYIPNTNFPNSNSSDEDTFTFILVNPSGKQVSSQSNVNITVSPIVYAD